MKFKRKSDGVVKDVPDQKLAERLSSNPNYEAVSDESGRSPASSQDSVEPGYLDDAVDIGRGVVQGGTLGFGDEIYGAGAATADKLGGMISGKDSGDWTDLYRKYQQSQQASNKESEERSPWLYGGGQLAGGVGAGLLTAGAMPAAAAGGLRGALQAGYGSGAQYLGTKALEGAILMGVNAAGTSEGNLDSNEGIAKLGGDVQNGIEMGGKLGFLAPIAGATLGAAKDKVVGMAKGNPGLKHFLNAYGAGKEGVPIGASSKGIENAKNVYRDANGNLVKNILNGDDILGSNYGKVVDAAEQRGVQVSMTEPFINSGVQINKLASDPILSIDKNFIELKNYFNQLQGIGHLSPRQALNLKEKVNILAEKYPNHSISGIAEQIATDVDGALKQAIPGFKTVLRNNSPLLNSEVVAEEFPGFKEVNQQLAGYRDALPDQILGGRLSDVKGDTAEALGKKLNTMLAGVRGGDKSAVTEGLKVDKIVEKLGEFERQNPGVLKTLGISPEEMQAAINNSSDAIVLMNKLLKGGSDLFNKPGLKNDVIKEFSMFTRGVHGTAQWAGGTRRKIGQWFSAPIEEVGELANKLSSSQNPTAQNVGKYLQDAVANKDDFKKNSALFIINQNPSLKSILGFDSEGDEN